MITPVYIQWPTENDLFMLNENFSAGKNKIKQAHSILQLAYPVIKSICSFGGKTQCQSVHNTLIKINNSNG